MGVRNTSTPISVGQTDASPVQSSLGDLHPPERRDTGPDSTGYRVDTHTQYMVHGTHILTHSPHTHTHTHTQTVAGWREEQRACSCIPHGQLRGRRSPSKKKFMLASTPVISPSAPSPRVPRAKPPNSRRSIRGHCPRRLDMATATLRTMNPPVRGRRPIHRG